VAVAELLDRTLSVVDVVTLAVLLIEPDTPVD
jgi:hypothetical protein